MTYPYKTNYIDLPGNANIAYIDEGKGARTLLFIHGLANYALVWKKNIDYLKQYYRCIAIDLPGNGLSGKNDHAFGIKFYAESVYNFITALKLKNLTIVGHSMGGQVSMAAVIKHPGCADSMVLCAPAGFEEFSELDKTLYANALHVVSFISSDEHSLRHTIESSFYGHHNQGESIITELTAIMKTYKASYYRRMLEESIKSMLDESVIGELGQIQQPTLVIFGKQDALIPNKLIHHTTTEKIAGDAVKKMPYATLEMLASCGHFVQWEKADEVNGLIIRFLEEGK